MPATARISQSDIERHFPPTAVRRLFSDDGSLTPGPRLATACNRASRVAESYLLRAWSLESIDVLFQEDEAIVGATCGLFMAYGAEGRHEWSGQGAPYEGLMKRCISELKELADAQRRSRAETVGAGGNPTLKGSISAPNEAAAYVFAESKARPRRGGY